MSGRYRIKFCGKETRNVRNLVGNRIPGRILTQMPIRFPNCSSDIPRLISTYRLIHEAAERCSTGVIDLHLMVEVLTNNYQASSRGAVGAEARLRSTGPDLSRNPLYNQLKMYSEIYRMLGWLRPGSKRLEFRTTVVGDLIAIDWADRPDLAYGLFRECLMAVVFPNPCTENRGVRSQRPFRWLLLMAEGLGGAVTKREIILGTLAVTDDTELGVFERSLETVRSIRNGTPNGAVEAVAAYAGEQGIQVTTIDNYTRLPVAVMKAPEIGWGFGVKRSDLYDGAVDACQLSAFGAGTAAALHSSCDIRERELEGFSLEERAHFSNFSYYAMVIRAGLDSDEARSHLARSSDGCQGILENFEITGPHGFLYSPLQQATDEILGRAAELD